MAEPGSVVKPDYQKWYVILCGLENEIKSAFPGPSPSIGECIAHEICGIRAVLRNSEKLERSRDKENS